MVVQQNTHAHMLLWLGERRLEPAWSPNRGVSNNRFIFQQRPSKTWPPPHCRSFVEEDKRSAPIEIPQPCESLFVVIWWSKMEPLKLFQFRKCKKKSAQVSTWGNPRSLTAAANTTQLRKTKAAYQHSPHFLYAWPLSPPVKTLPTERDWLSSKLRQIDPLLFTAAMHLWLSSLS